MDDTTFLRFGDLIVIGISLSIMVVIGFVTSRRNESADTYFMAGRKMPGWVVGFSIMATLISSSSFLALPELAYQLDWRILGTCAVYPFALIMAYRWFMPFFRKSRISSAYEYLERRFGTWARLYVAFAFILLVLLKMGIVLYGTSVAMKTVSGYSVTSIIFVFGLVVILYTVVGGLEAVIWTDLFQGLGLMVGGAICLPIISGQLPGGVSQIFQEAAEGDKMSLAIDEWQFIKFGFLVIILGNFFDYLRMTTTDQMFVQRYCAPKSDGQAKNAIVVATITSVLIWCYFTFLGTALWVFYRNVPDARVSNLETLEIFPHFIITQLPVGMAGFVLAALIMAAMSTLDSSINACAATVVSDFYRRLFAPNESERHYLRAGQLFSIGFGLVMIVSALYINYSRTTALQELQNILMAICSSGLAGIFMLGFVTRRAHSRAILAATLIMLVCVVAWLILDRTIFQGQMPHKLWLAVFTNIFVFGVGYGFSVLFPVKKPRDLAGLTLWTQD